MNKIVIRLIERALESLLFLLTLTIRSRRLKQALCLVSLLATAAFCLSAPAPEFLWARAAGGTNYDYAQSLGVDKSGNVLVTGSFLSYSLPLGGLTLTNQSAPNSEIFLVKYGPAGNVLWGLSAGGSGNDDPQSIALDDAGNIYLAGEFDSTNFTLGSLTLRSSGGYDAFIAKLDSSGNPLWARQGGGASSDYGYAVALDHSGQDIYLAGSFASTNASFGGFVLTNVSNASDIFLARYDSQGNVLWVRQAGGSDYDLAFGASADSSGNVVVTGWYFSTNLTFGNLALTNASAGVRHGDMFVAKFDPAGTLLWAKRAGGTDEDRPEDVVMDSAGNAHIVGYSSSSNATFGSVTLTNGTPGSARLFLATYDGAGTVLWARHLDATNGGTIQRIALDSVGNIYLGGTFSGTAVLGGTTLTAAGLLDTLVAKCDRDGLPIWAKRAGGSSTDYGSGVAVDGSGNLYVAGFFGSNDAAWDDIPLPNSGKNDMFVARLGYVQPVLNLVRSGSYMVLFWPDSFPTFAPQATTNLGANLWAPLSTVPARISDQMIVVDPVVPGSKYYRLKGP